MIKNKGYKLRKLYEEQQGFLSIDVLVLSVIITAMALSYALLGNINNAQQNGAYRTTALFLAQQHLNESEHGIVHGVANQNSDRQENISLNGRIFEIYTQIDKDVERYRIKVEVKWNYEGKVQSEVQERQIVAR